MPELTAWAWTALTLGALIVGLSKAALPGGGTLAAALFALALPAKASTGILLVLLILGDLFALWAYRAHADFAVLRRLIPTVLGGVVLGALFMAVATDALVGRVIAVILLALIALTLLRRRAPARTAEAVAAGPRRLEAGAFGVLGGFTTMVANAGGPVMSLYFLAMRLSVWAFLGTSAWFFFAVNLVKVPFSVGLGLITADSLLINAVLAPVVIAGALAGRRLAAHMDQAVFEKLVLALTLISAVNLLL
jgi:uncharacterized membrane protein YfcA